MATEVKTQAESDAEEIVRLASEGKIVTDPAMIRRIAERSEKVRRQIVEKYGIVDWAVDLIREGRDE